MGARCHQSNSKRSDKSDQNRYDTQRWTHKAHPCSPVPKSIMWTRYKDPALRSRTPKRRRPADAVVRSVHDSAAS